MSKLVTKDIINLYILEQKSTHEIARILHCSVPAVCYHLKKANVKIRPLKGIKRSEKTKKLVSQNHANVSGKNNPMFGKKAELSPSFGKKRTDEQKLYLSLKFKGKKRPDFVGEKNPNWKGNTPLIQMLRVSAMMQAWRNDIFKRDNFTCQSCGHNKGNILEAHHVQFLSYLIIKHKICSTEQAYNINELWDIKNGITLCKGCHTELHKNGKRE